MAKVSIIKSANDLITSDEQIMEGFVKASLIKSSEARPYIEEAKKLREMASKVNTPRNLLLIEGIKPFLITASGLSDKAIQHFDEKILNKSISKMIDDYLVSAGDSFVDELVYRFLLIKGGSLSGSTNNTIGALAQKKFVDRFLFVLDSEGLTYEFTYSQRAKNRRVVWRSMSYNEASKDVDRIKAFSWMINGKKKVLFFNAKIPSVGEKGNNVDICLYDHSVIPYSVDLINSHDECAIMFGELKGGFDPAGADEHWKTGNTALGRIRDAFASQNIPIYTSFIGVAIQESQANEIYAQLKSNELSYAINLNNDKQLTEYCKWIIGLEKKEG